MKAIYPNEDQLMKLAPGADRCPSRQYYNTTYVPSSAGPATHRFTFRAVEVELKTTNRK